MKIREPIFWIKLILAIGLYIWAIVGLIDNKCSLSPGMVNTDFLEVPFYYFYILFAYILLTSIVATTRKKRFFVFIIITTLGSFLAYYAWFMISREVCPEFWFGSYF